tara:strand:+ start:1419 stop:2105 length:687 start_codon:yes stop_codon:yes gene_type:complete
MFKVDRKTAQLIVLQRIELISPLLKKLRKIFGRSIFTNYVSRYLINSKDIGNNYFQIMSKEFNSIKNSISGDDKTILSIGGGVGGLEVIINNHFNDMKFYFIEKNYISKKVVYNWDMTNKEAYNDLKLQEEFLINNGLKNFSIYDYDKNHLPDNKFDIIISLFSLDYHYDFYLYLDFLKNACNIKTKVIFDTIRPDHFTKIFNEVVVLKTFDNTVHKSKRLLCTGLKI